MEAVSFTHFRSFRSPVSAIWPCLTLPHRLAGWLGEADFDLGFNGTLSLRTWNGDAFHGRVVAAVPPAKLDATWRLFESDSESRVSWRLSGDGPGSRLTVTQDGLRTREERDHARLFWRDALDALHGLADEGIPSGEWGAAHPVTVCAFLPRTAADLWPALSTAAGLSKWVATVEEFDPQPGGAFRFRSRYKGHDVIEQGTIQEIVPDSRLRLSWEWIGEEWNGATEVLLALEPEAGGTTCLVAHSGFDRINPDRALEARRNYATGWPEVLSDLKRLVSPLATAR